MFALHIDGAHFPGGAFGVDVFFVLSAYLITGNLLREHATSGGISLRGFYWRRVFRLAPALFAWLLLLAIPTAIAAHQTKRIPWSTAGSLLYFCDFLQAWTHLVATAFDQTWSLAVEEQFYIVWPALLILLVLHRASSHQRRFFVTLVVVCLLVDLTTSSYFLPTGHLIALALGAWAADQAIRGYDDWLAPLMRQPIVVSIIGAVVVLSATFARPTNVDARLVAIVVDIVTVAIIIALETNRESVSARTLGSALLRWIGKRSYGIYLYGLTLMQLVGIVTGLSLRYAGPIDVALTGIIVAVSYRLLEAPVRRRGRAWLNRNTASS